MHVGGHVEENELLDEALRREVKEEVNLDIEIIGPNSGSLTEYFARDMVPQSMPFFIYGVKQGGESKIYIDYLCTAKEPINIRLQKAELADFRWVAEDELAGLNAPELLKILAIRAFKEISKSGCK